jgi:hypothetical protein
MRLGGFEPPTRGLEGRRSSTELQAQADGEYRFDLLHSAENRRDFPQLSQRRVPKSVVMIVAGRPA